METYTVKFNCVKCGNLQESNPIYSISGIPNLTSENFSNWARCDQCLNEETRQKAIIESRRKRYSNLSRAGFPIDIVSCWQADSDKRNRELEDWIEENRAKSLWIAGYNQVGKTFAVSRLAEVEMKYGYHVKWVDGTQLIRGYIDCLTNKTVKAKDYIKSYSNCALLIIDDLEKIGKFSETAGELLVKIFDANKPPNKRIWITTNLVKGQLQTMFYSDNQFKAVYERIKNRFTFWQG